LFKRADSGRGDRVSHARCGCDGDLKFDTFMLMSAAELESVLIVLAISIEIGSSAN
jgi:hypothetical protein